MSDVVFGLVQDFPALTTPSATFDHEDSALGGNTPTACLHMVCRATAINTPTSHAVVSFGAAKSTTTGENFMYAANSEHGSSNTDTSSKAMEVQKVAFIGTPGIGSRDGWTTMDTTPFAADKATYKVDNSYDGLYATLSLLFGGADLITDVGTFTLNDLSIDDEIVIPTGIDMRNAALILFSPGNTVFGTGTGSISVMYCNLGLGANDGGTFSQACAAIAEADGSAEGDPVAYLSNLYILQTINKDTGAAEWALQWTSATSTNATVTVRVENSSGTDNVGYIAIALPSDYTANVSVQDTPTTDDSAKEYTPGFSGWTPEILIQILTLLEAVNTAKDDNTAGGLGMRIVTGTGSTDEYCMTFNIEDGVSATTTDTECGMHDSGWMNEDDGTAGYEMDLVSFDSGGWTDNFADSLPTAKKTICLVMGQDDAGGGGRIMGSLAYRGGLVGVGGIAGSSGGIAG